MVCKYLSRGRVEQQRFGQTPFFLRDRCKSFQFLGVYDREIEPDLRAVVEKNRVNDLTSRSRQSKGDVGNPEDSFDVRDLLLDEAD